MPSSTSSSDSHSRAPELPALKAWVLGLVVFVSALGGAEVFWRAQGHVPSLNDSRSLWASRRAALSDASQPVALLGASRIQLGFDMATWRQQVPDQAPFMLAIEGSSPLPLLEDLARDTDFKGLVVVSLHEDMLEPYRQTTQRGYVRYYHHEFHFGAQIERRLQSLAQRRFVLFNPGLGPLQVLKTLASKRHLPEPNYIATTAERERSADYFMRGDAWQEKTRAWRLKRDGARAERHPPSAPEVWAQRLDAIASHVKTIEDRGGKVALVRLPQSGELAAQSEALYPRARYWDVLAERFGERAIHHRDVDAWSALSCPDGSHVDQKDKAALTQGLVEVLRARGLVTSP